MKKLTDKPTIVIAGMFFGFVLLAMACACFYQLNVSLLIFPYY
ncbi:MAG: hypothetical protein WA173_17935 [Pseudomonas sp.]